MLLVTVLCVWLGVQANRARNTRLAIDVVEELGGEITYAPVLPGPTWLRETIGDEYFVDVAGIRFSRSSITNDDLEQLCTCLKKLENLQLLEFSHCDSLSDVTALQGLTKLQHFYLSGCPISDISGLQGLNKLQTLGLADCPNLSDISGLQGLSNLQTLYLGDCDNLSDISALQGLTNLQTLSLAGDNLSDISALQGLTNLQTLDLSFCDNLSNITGLEGLTKLQYLYLEGCDNVSDISALQGHRL